MKLKKSKKEYVCIHPYMYLCIEVQAKITVTTPKIVCHLVNGCYCHNQLHPR